MIEEKKLTAEERIAKLWNHEVSKENLDGSIGVLQRLLWLTVPGDHESPLKSPQEQFDLMAKVNAHLAATVQIGTFTAMMMSTAIDDNKKQAILDDLARCCLGVKGHEWKGAKGNGAKTRGDLAAAPPPPPDEPKTVVPPPPPPPAPKLTVPRLLREFIPKRQASAIRSCMKGEEGQHFSDMLAGWVAKIKAMPLYYSTEKVKPDDKVIHLHYFSSSMDWYIAEMDPDAFTPCEDYPQGPGPNRVFGLSCMQVEEWGGISILEMCESEHVTFDEDWKAKTVKEIFADKETAGEDEKEVKACQFCSLPVTEEGMEICDSCNPTEPTDECAACRRVKVTGAIMHCETCSEEINAMQEAEIQLADEALFPHTTTDEILDNEAEGEVQNIESEGELPDPYIQGQKDDIEEVINPLKTKDGTPMDQAAKQAAEDARHHYSKAVELHQIRELLNEFMTEQAGRDKKLLDMVEGEITLARGEALRSAEATQKLIKDIKFEVTNKTPD